MTEQSKSKTGKGLFNLYNPALEDEAAEKTALSKRLLDQAAEVKSRWLVEEKPFKSGLPFVASVRERFNSISTRWYVKPILAQQVEFNAAVSRSIEDLTQIVTGSTASQDMQTALLSARLIELENRLENIENLLEKLLSQQESTGK
ncbi:MAG TPA: hypothetical protein VH186_18125 [Chloroflexia bacterium]|nr:hypothetical protein [Chloroflexia bacterium]